jgi:hypothetical protein
MKKNAWKLIDRNEKKKKMKKKKLNLVSNV